LMVASVRKVTPVNLMKNVAIGTKLLINAVWLPQKLCQIVA